MDFKPSDGVYIVDRIFRERPHPSGRCIVRPGIEYQNLSLLYVPHA